MIPVICVHERAFLPALRHTFRDVNVTDFIISGLGLYKRPIRTLNRNMH